MGSILTTLTNLSLNDSNNVKIRLHGAHIIGKILMENCPALTKNSDSHKVYIEDNSENTKIQHELQLHCLRCLRFLYSMEKNRKAFKVIFPPNVFGEFIDVGNYNKDFQAYIPLLKRINKKSTEDSLKQIKENFE
jgi:NIMA (never in mitosis gene a)-related kinase